MDSERIPPGLATGVFATANPPECGSERINNKEFLTLIPKILGTAVLPQGVFNQKTLKATLHPFSNQLHFFRFKGFTLVRTAISSNAFFADFKFAFIL